jgi:hypothetical protein
MNIFKKCSNCGAEVDTEGTVKSGMTSGGNIVPTMQVDENGTGPDVKECYKQGICPCCLSPTLKYIENSKEKGQ